MPLPSKKRRIPLPVFLITVVAVAAATCLATWFFVQQAAEDEIRLLREEQAEELAALQEEPTAKLAALKAQQEKALDALRETQDKEFDLLRAEQAQELSALLEKHAADLDTLLKEQPQQLNTLLEDQKKELEALQKKQSEKLDELLREQTAALEALQVRQAQELAALQEKLLPETSFDLDRLLALDKIFGQHALNGTDRDALTDALLDAYAANIGDHYAAHYTNEEYLAVLNKLSGRFVGVGVTVTPAEQGIGLHVISVYKDSSAAEEGLLAGDLITAVDGTSLQGLAAEQAAALMRGEENSKVTLTVQRGTLQLTFTLQRRTVVETTVTGKMLEGNIAYVYISRFSEETPGQLAAQVEQLEQNGAVAFIFDVRNNPGGLVQAMALSLGYLLPDGPLVHVRYKSDAKTYTMSAKDGILRQDFANGEYNEIKTDLDMRHKLTCPVAVLVNGSTASAGEGFAAAFRDYAAKGLVNATLFGEKTFGKGVVQVTHRTGEGDAFRLTVATYDPPYGTNYDGIGVTPDELVAPAPEDVGKSPEMLSPETDTQLIRAITWLNQASK